MVHALASEEFLIVITQQKYKIIFIVCIDRTQDTYTQRGIKVACSHKCVLRISGSVAGTH